MARSLEAQLKAYALAAAATSAGLLALSNTANAAVVYTPTKITLLNGQVNVDVDGDGVTDFTLVDQDKLLPLVSSNRMLGVKGPTGAAVVKGNGGAAAMLMNSIISSGRSFQAIDKARGRMASVGYKCVGSSNSNCVSFVAGPFKQVKNKYLGFKFTISGQTHYGWARLNVDYTYQNGGNSIINVYLSGYAYESVAGGSIKAGQTTGADAQVRGSLGELARGAAK
jgi:hypothetical protein